MLSGWDITVPIQMWSVFFGCNWKVFFLPDDLAGRELLFIILQVVKILKVALGFVICTLVNVKVLFTLCCCAA